VVFKSSSTMELVWTQEGTKFRTVSPGKQNAVFWALFLS